MMRPILAAACLSLALAPYDREDAAPLAPDRPLASLVPEGCAVYVESPGLARLLAQGVEHELVRAFLATPAAARLTERAPLTPTEALARADAWLGATAMELTGALTARGVGIGFDPRTRKALLVTLARDARAAERGLDLVLDAVERQAGWPGALDEPRRRVRGAAVWTLGELVLARREALVVVSNDADLVDEALDLAADPAGRGLLARAGLESALAARPRDALLWGWLELEELAPHADAGFRELRAAERTPAAHALLGSELAALVSARALSFTLTGAAAGATLELRAIEAPVLASLAPLARAGEVAAAPAGDGSPGVASALVYRDYARFLSERVEHFPPEALPAFAEAISNGALFFEGRDLGEDVLRGVSPWLRLVVREITLPAERRPEIPLPGVAVVAVMDEPEAGERWIAAFQSIVSIINVDQAQQGKGALRLVVGREGDVEVSAARYAAPPAGRGMDVRYNLQPAIAASGRHLVLGTHEDLVRALVRELAGKSPVAAESAHESLAVDAGALVRLLEANRAHLVARKMLTDGLARAAAESELDGLRDVLESLGELRVEIASEDPAAPVLRVALSFREGGR